MNNWDDLYLEVILDHNKNPRNNHDLENHTHHAEGHNPLCGDRISMNILMNEGVVKDISFKGSGCAISTASASILTETIKNKNQDEIRNLFKDFHNLVTNEKEIEHDLGKLKIFEGVKKYPARVKCATLSWHTLTSAIEKTQNEINTEKLEI